MEDFNPAENPYVTLSGTMNELRKQGYVEDFNLLQQCLVCRNGQYKVFADEFTVDSFYRFEGPSDPSDLAILYAISSERYGLKGLLVNGYGISSDSVTDEMLQKLTVGGSGLT
ncbi:hypothetical protein GCM10028808_08550 [Spirosoma migulaei]